MSEVQPNGCRWCGLPERGHYRQWTTTVGWHTWVAPSDEQRLFRMQVRAAGRMAGK